MKLSCEIVKDLLPLYEEGLCSEESRTAVDAHLEQCTSCAQVCGRVRALKIPEIQLPKQEKAVAKSFRKVRRRWVASVLLVIVLLPLLACAGWMGWNQYRHEGICYTNLDDIALAWKFAKLLEQGKYEQAAEYIDRTGDYESIHEALGLAWEDNMPNMRKVQIGDEIWMADPQLVDRYLQDTQDPGQIWSGLIYNGADVTLIPADTFRAVTEQSPAEGHWEGTVYYTRNDYAFAPFQTQWGSFMAERNCWEDLKRYENDPVMLCYLLWLYPLQMYEDTLPQLEIYAKDQWQSSQNWNAPYANMTFEEYTAYKNEIFVQALETCHAQGIRIKPKGFHSAYGMETTWDIRLEVQVSKKGESLNMGFNIYVRDGKVHNPGLRFEPGAPKWINELLMVL